MSTQREFTIQRLDEIMPEVDRLLAGGYTKAGNWSLGQVCNHLAETFRMSIEGFPVKSPWIVQMTIAKLVKKQLFKSGKMRAGIKVPDKFLPKPELDDRAEAEALRAALAYYATNTSPRADHPFFGKMTDADWVKLHCIHSAHHLAFLLPK